LEFREEESNEIVVTASKMPLFPAGSVKKPEGVPDADIKGVFSSSHLLLCVRLGILWTQVERLV
jgi:hypothetical protein